MILYESHFQVDHVREKLILFMFNLTLLFYAWNVIEDNFNIFFNFQEKF